MDIEQLKLILESLEGLGGNAQEFGIWYLVCSTAPEIVSSVLSTLCFIAGFACCYKIVKYITNLINAGYTIARAINHSVSSTWYPSDTRAICNQILELKRIKESYNNIPHEVRMKYI